MASIAAGMNHQGALILIEKLTLPDGMLNRLFIKYYYDLKRRNGYSEMEIAKKREALENVMIPYQLDENLALLRGAGFTHADVFFRWYNFCGILAVK
jgi:tRNA (cmo5U34)-methyltransferase